ncbi:phage tail protein [Desulfobulbus elongatus]|uniref:phage tail protein n=1 Tax=Desulfobulbus elongatus TaxID=53332 RepID=UPI000A53A701|nr:phage tail protein [Desulfobulbus elongatus]
MPTYYTLLTAVGRAKIENAIALGQTIEWTHMAVGDGNGNPTVPTDTQTALLRERYRAGVNSLTVDAENPQYVVAELIIPANVGGWLVHEVGIFDSDGDMVAVANFPVTYKPVLDEGSGRDLAIRILVEVANTAAVTLKIDPTLVLASRQYVDQSVAAHEAKSNPHPQYATKTGVQAQAHTSSAAGGTADAITASFTPAIGALTNGMMLLVRAGAANATTSPTFTPNSGPITAKTIVKGNGLPLVAGDIAGAGHWLALQYDSALDKWALINPASSVVTRRVDGITAITVEEE